MVRGLCLLLSLSTFLLAGPADDWLAKTKASLLRVAPGANGDQAALLAQPRYRALLLRHELLRATGPAAINRLLTEEGSTAFVGKFLGDPEWLGMFLCSGPVTAPDRCLRHLHRIWQQDPDCARQAPLKSLATAVALEFGRRDWPDDRAWQRYTFYRDSARDGLLHPSYDRLHTWERRFLVGHGLSMHGEPNSQRWLRDNVKLPIEQYRKACWQLSYRGYNLFGDTVQSWKYYLPFEGSFGSFTEMTRFVGGVCGRLSGYGAGAAVANGIPATIMCEPGHCAYAVRLAPDNWAPAYSLSWKRGVHVNLYGPSWGMLVLTDRMLGNPAWERATLLRFQARLYEPGVQINALERTVFHGQWQKLPNLAELQLISKTPAAAISPTLDGRRSNYALLYTGQITCTTNGRYALALTSDDGSRLWIDGKEAIDNDGLHASQQKTAELDLTAGTHPFQLAYFQVGGGATLSLTARSVSPSPASIQALQLATMALPVAYPAWDELGRAFAGGPDPQKALRTYQKVVLRDLAGFPEQSYQLLSRHVYPVLLKDASPTKALPVLLAFHRKADDWGPGRWDVEKALDEQAKYLGDDPDMAFRFLGGLLKAHADGSVYFGPALTWGLGRFGKDEKQRERFFATVTSSLRSGTPTSDTRKAILDMCSDALLAAENAKDEETYQAVGSLIDSALEPAPAAKPALPGDLLSDKAFVRFSSVSARWDHPWQHWLIPSNHPGANHTDEEQNPWLELRLRHFGEIRGIEVVNRKTHRERAVPLVVEVSEDGTDWQQVARWEKAEPSWKADLANEPVRARFVRVRKEGRGFLHLVNVRVYGRRVS